MKQYIYSILIGFCICLWACTDNEDTLLSQEIPSTEANIKFTICTPDMPIASRAISTTMTDLDGVAKYTILFYSKNNGTWELAKILNKTNSNATSLNTTQSFETADAIPPGTYKIYIIANLDYKIEGGDKITSVSTIDKLKELTYEWDDKTKKIMFGFFIKASDKPYDSDSNTPNDTVTKLENDIDRAIRTKGLNKVSPTDYDAPEITIEEGKIQAHLTAKLYRMASAVSVFFNSYDMDEGVTITIKSVRLKNIPRTCYLWKENTATTFMNDDQIDCDFSFSRYRNTQEPGRNEYKGNIKDFADENGNLYVFYLFENRQGTTNTTSMADKTISPKPNASYLEVIATNSTAPGKEFTYRCALGEDAYEGDTFVYNNYNVTRNRHYKVYFTFKGTGTSPSEWRAVVTSAAENIQYSVGGSEWKNIDSSFTLANDATFKIRAYSNSEVTLAYNGSTYTVVPTDNYVTFENLKASNNQVLRFSKGYAYTDVAVKTVDGKTHEYYYDTDANQMSTYINGTKENSDFISMNGHHNYNGNYSTNINVLNTDGTTSSKTVTTGEHMGGKNQYISLNLSYPMNLEYIWTPRNENHNGAILYLINGDSASGTEKTDTRDSKDATVTGTYYTSKQMLFPGKYTIATVSGETTLLYLRLTPVL